MNATHSTDAAMQQESVRPVAYVSLQDPVARARIVRVLEQARWAVIPQPTGFHLLRAISGLIDGSQPWLQPSLIVVDAWARGCTGTSIAAGLRDLGITIPIVLIAGPGEALPVSPDATLRIVDAAAAESAVAEILQLQATRTLRDHGAVASSSSTANASRVTAST